MTDMSKAELARAERAEAACAQMRAALEATSVATYPCTDAGNSAHAAMQAALASDCGVGWVSPEQHAEVVRERDEARLAKPEPTLAAMSDQQ